MLNAEQGAKECDATADDSKVKAGNINIYAGCFCKYVKTTLVFRKTTAICLTFAPFSSRNANFKAV